MKRVQIMMDEALLRELDGSEEVKREGRSAVLRRAAADYLLRRRNDKIRERYQRAYADEGGLGDDFAGWEEQGQWPD